MINWIDLADAQKKIVEDKAFGTWREAEGAIKSAIRSYHLQTRPAKANCQPDDRNGDDDLLVTIESTGISPATCTQIRINFDFGSRRIRATIGTSVGAGPTREEQHEWFVDSNSDARGVHFKNKAGQELGAAKVAEEILKPWLPLS